MKSAADQLREISLRLEKLIKPQVREHGRALPDMAQVAFYAVEYAQKNAEDDRNLLDTIADLVDAVQMENEQLRIEEELLRQEVARLRQEVRMGVMAG